MEQECQTDGRGGRGEDPDDGALHHGREPQDQPTAEVLSGVLGGRLRVLGPVLVPVVPLMGRDAHAKEDTERVRPR